MQAFKCDICGKLYESYTQTKCYKDGKYQPSYNIYIKENPDAYSHSLDLCEDCQKRLVDFINNVR